MRALFICGKARRRSPSAVHIAETEFSAKAQCAGLSRDADEPLSREAIDRSDVIFVVEPRRKARLNRAFKPATGGRKIISLDIPDRCEAMDADLIDLHCRRLGAHPPKAVRG